MDKLPKIARDRLQQSGPAGPHPDANLISAFVEGSLTPRERSQVLVHLAQCANCRAIAECALPKSAAVAPVPAERTWLRWTVIRWGTLAASAVIIAVAILVLRPPESGLRPTPAPSVREAAPAEPAPAPEAKKADEAQVAQPEARAAEKENGAIGKLQAAPKREDSFVSRADAAKEQQAAPVASRNMGYLARNQQRVGGPSQSNVQNQVFAQQNQNVSAPPATPPPPPASVVAGALPAAAPAAVLDRAEKSAAPPVPTTMTKAVPAQRALGMAGGLPSLRKQAAARKASADEGMVRWTVGEGGHVMRSLDGGRTWSDMAVAERVVFRALSAIGSDVWAGGAGGALFHSSDAGAHWTRVRPASNGTELAADIVRIEFTDLHHGTLTTADGDQWVTADGGQSWSVIAH